jgi:hypothetical protein
VTEPVLAVDLGPERELHLPTSYHREIAPSRLPIGCDDVFEELSRTPTSNGKPKKGSA